MHVRMRKVGFGGMKTELLHAIFPLFLTDISTLIKIPLFLSRI